MDRRELLRRITAFPLTASGLSEDLLSGGYRSVFKGQGIEFDEARYYEIGDDARFIDWNVSARFGEPYVKMYREERELSVFVIMDTSPSMHTGWGEMSSYEQGIFVAALIAFSAEKAGQRVGALFFDRDITQVFPPRKSRRHIMSILGSAAAIGSDTALPAGSAQASNLRAALQGAGRFLKRRSLVVVVSDFFAGGWEQEFEDLAARHDLIAIGIGNSQEGEFSDLGLIPLEDPETGVSFYGATAFPGFRKAWSHWNRERREYVESLCRRAGAACLFLSSAEDTPTALTRFFSGRRPTRRFRRKRV
ncbi:MAG: DUF58 domain-containing protein [Treponema sp.]|jgi:uncharacterized protein (DUF58 family)|nr:DUF58 domain-containing protein [Treponema sp.]